MTAKKKSQFSSRHTQRLSLLIVIFGILALTIAFGAQKKPPATFADYGKWESLAPAGDYGGFSPDGQWMAYAINRSNGENELRITKIADGKTEIAAFGARPAFSSDSNWIAYSIGKSEAEREKLQKQKKPVQNKLGLRNLVTGETETVDGIQSFAFSQDGAFLAMERYRPERPSGSASPPGRGGSGETEERPGTTLIVRDFGSGRDTTFGNVSQYAWQNTENTHMLAMTISAEGKTGNGVHLFDPGSAVLRVLDSSPSIYKGLAWRKDAAALAVLRAKTDDKKEGSTHVVMAWIRIGQNEHQYTYDPMADSTFPEGMRTVTFRPLSWSEDGKVLFFGIAKWDDKIEQEKKDKTGEKAKEEKAKAKAKAKEEEKEKEEEKDSDAATKDEPATVEIWHWKDVYVMPWQKVHADQDRQRNMLAAWHLEIGKFVQLGQDFIHERVIPIRYTNLAYVAEWSKYAMERSIGRPAADIYLQDISTGERTLIKECINDRYIQASPGGKYLLFMQEGHFWTIDLATNAITNITEKAPVSFINMESDSTQKVYPDKLQKPPFGVAGWTKSDADILLYDKYDMWQVAADGLNVQRLTDGAAEKVRHRLVRLDESAGGLWWRRSTTSQSAEDLWIDFSKPVYMSLYGEWTKKSGYAQIKPDGDATRLVWLDKNVGSLAKAKDAEVYRYIMQDYDDSPDIYVGGANLKDAKQVTKTNPFQSDYAWGRSELIDYVTDKGRKLQGALFYPAGYEPGKKYPMIVYNYELLSQNVHRYVAPSDRSYYNISVFTSQGYFVLEPDIVFRIRQPGWSVVECVTAGVDKVIEMGVVDPERIGIIGHSMGGFNTSFVATHTNGIFAAAVAGAPITDLVSYYGDHHWGSGVAETDHIETGQERMEVALYEDFQAYVDNSAVYNVHNMTTPLLLEHGDSDGIIAWYQSIMLYNIARRAKKNVVMLGYIGSDHGLRKKHNQKDYQRRILAWFGHYLKGEPAEDWITKGKSFLEREAEIKRLKAKK
ncbi:MAG: S9 family peptidase [Candidatus Aminicenantes bacterium]|nr:MAG: S9 family peptidase [Candidatus Aminicenantes bacterium]